MINKLFQWWQTEKFPLIHLQDKTSFFKKWFLHPFKRRLAKYYLILLKEFTDIKVIGITGSAGKTTTKEMLAAILKLHGKTVWTVANIDPIYNIPTTILKTPPGTKYLILEMGVEYPNEMDFYTWLARPDVGIITNIFPTHLEFMKSIDGVFNEKIKLVSTLEADGVAVLNASDRMLTKVRRWLKRKTFWFVNGVTPFETNGNTAKNAAKALAVPERLIKKGLENYNAPEHRLNIIELKNNIKVLDDCYNNNPEAFLTSLKYFLKIAGKMQKTVIFGDMLELGRDEESEHRRIGKKIALSGINYFLGVGKASKFTIDEIKKYNNKIKTNWVENVSVALPLLDSLLTKDTFIFVKGSRSIHLEKLVDKLS